jgi:hypothetical protein
VLTLFIAAACAPATEITLDIHTDVPCTEVEGVGVWIGPRGNIDESSPVLIATDCSADTSRNVIGTLAVVPQQGAADLSVRVALGEHGVTVETDCTAAKGFQQCIVARRSLNFVSRHDITVPIDLLLVCEGVACQADTTCNRLGRCVASNIDPQACDGDTCATTVTTAGSLSNTAPALPNHSTWVATPNSLLADDTSQSKLTLTLHDGFDKPVVGEVVSLSATGLDNNWASNGNTTDDAGIFVAYLASSLGGLKTVTASTTDLSMQTAVTFVAIDGGADGGP